MKDYLIIDRKKWRRGGESHDEEKGLTYLLNKEGYMCCLGMRCNQMGISKKELLGKTSPTRLINYDIPDLLDEKGYNTKFCDEAMEINDDSIITEKIREKLLKKHFAAKDIIVEFIN
jgi:hypothetical protein